RNEENRTHRIGTRNTAPAMPRAWRGDDGRAAGRTSDGAAAAVSRISRTLTHCGSNLRTTSADGLMASDRIVTITRFRCLTDTANGVRVQLPVDRFADMLGTSLGAWPTERHPGWVGGALRDGKRANRNVESVS